eukprot:NODE_162_length_14959_cov_1.379610.p13 type:complete len:109 gc:universal NODE_162_length_14959_cov_1.379610:4530-4856(+)
MFCEWGGCHQILTKEETLNHLSDHVGFKRRNSFDGICRWKHCNVRKSDRTKLISHVISHIKVVFYNCECGKTFKRKSDHAAHRKKCNAYFDSIVNILFEGLPDKPTEH